MSKPSEEIKYQRLSILPFLSKLLEHHITSEQELRHVIAERCSKHDSERLTKDQIRQALESQEVIGDEGDTDVPRTPWTEAFLTLRRRFGLNDVLSREDDSFAQSIDNGVYDTELRELLARWRLEEQRGFIELHNGDPLLAWANKVDNENRTVDFIQQFLSKYAGSEYQSLVESAANAATEEFGRVAEKPSTDKVSVDGRATAYLIELAQVVQHSVVAAAIGANPKSLTQRRCPNYFATRRRLRVRERQIRGEKTQKGNIQAWEE